MDASGKDVSILCYFPRFSLIFLLSVCHFAFTLLLPVYCLSFSSSAPAFYWKGRWEMNAFGYSGVEKMVAFTNVLVKKWVGSLRFDEVDLVDKVFLFFPF